MRRAASRRTPVQSARFGLGERNKLPNIGYRQPRIDDKHQGRRCHGTDRGK